MTEKLLTKKEAEEVLERDKNKIISLFLPIAKKLVDSSTISDFFKSEGASLSFDTKEIQEKLPDGWCLEL